jgi:hypothetical protein
MVWSGLSVAVWVYADLSVTLILLLKLLLLSLKLLVLSLNTDQPGWGEVGQGLLLLLLDQPNLALGPVPKPLNAHYWEELCL